MNKKEKYRIFCEKEESISIFSQPWWLDLVTGNSWDVCLVEEDGNIIATMPFFLKKNYGFQFIYQPILTQNLGPWFREFQCRENRKILKQKKIMNLLIKQLPKYDFFYQDWQYKQNNWLPFYWHGFDQTTNYTYVIDDISNLNVVWNNFDVRIRREIRKSEDKYNLKIDSNSSIDDFLNLNKITFNRQGMKVPYSEILVKKIAEKAKLKNSCKWFIAKDSNGESHGGVLIIWDKNSAFYLMGGSKIESRKMGAITLCMWEAIKFASTVTKKFDFEGSMIENIEYYFRGFGAIQKAYFSLTHIPSKIFRTIFFLRKTFKKR